MSFLVYNPSLTVSVFVESIWVDFCCKGPICVPCGFTWMSWYSFVLIETKLVPGIPDVTNWVAFAISGPRPFFDETPPSVGRVSIRQISRSLAQIESVGFEDKESEIKLFYVAVIRTEREQDYVVSTFEEHFENAKEKYEVDGEVKARRLFYEVAEGDKKSAEQLGVALWSLNGSKPVPKSEAVLAEPVPETRDNVVACAKACNPGGFEWGWTSGYKPGVCSYKCSEGISWDATPPELLGVRYMDPISQKFTTLSDVSCGFVKEDNWGYPIRDPTIPLSDCAVPFFTNLTHEFAFEMDARDSESGEISYAMWSLSPDLKTEPDAANFSMVGSEEQLRLADKYDGVTITFSSSNVPAGVLVHGATLYLNLWLCDQYDNCKRTGMLRRLSV